MKPRLEIMKPDGSLAKYTNESTIKPLVPIKYRWMPYATDGSVSRLRHDPGTVNEEETIEQLGTNLVRVDFDEPLTPGREITWRIEMYYHDSFPAAREFMAMLISQKTKEIMCEVLFPEENIPVVAKAVYVSGEQGEQIDPDQPSFDPKNPRRLLWQKRNPVRGAEYRIVWDWKLLGRMG